eukprot:m.107561 g.107561  ORF g.107561 m.107561 type:complete len:149 (-) comp13935_c0_seq1:144-590(-)
MIRLRRKLLMMMSHKLVIQIPYKSEKKFAVLVHLFFNPDLKEEQRFLRFASYQTPELMERFFAKAHDALAVDGKVIVIYSNYAELAVGDEKHPVREELKLNDRFVRLECIVEKVPLPSKIKSGKIAKYAIQSSNTVLSLTTIGGKGIS